MRLQQAYRSFQSTLPVWGATTCGRGRKSAHCISIHAPRVGSDLAGMSEDHARRLISIHAPRVGSDVPRANGSRMILNFNPRSPCGERPQVATALPSRTQFQSTLPVWGATYLCQRCLRYGKFQSTLPVWGATSARNSHWCAVGISIHAPRVGSDAAFQLVFQDVKPISIHAPRVGSDRPALLCLP